MSYIETRLHHCIQLLSSFPKDAKSLTIHVEEYFAILSVDDNDKSFIIDIFAEVIKYHKILETVIDRFYQLEGRTLFLRDKTLYFVLLFFIVFRLDEIGIDDLKKYFATQNIKVMHRFLSFIIDEEILYNYTVNEWKRLYDSIFVDNELMDGLKRWLPELHRFSQEMKDVIDNKPTKSKPPVTLTKIQPFNLTEPKPKKIPVPEPLPVLEKPKEIPTTTYTTSEINLKHSKKDPQELLKNAQRLGPSCADKTISKKTKEKMQNIVEEREKELKFSGIKARPVPKACKSVSDGQNFNVKGTTATILREWQLYQKRQQQKEKELKKLEEGEFNSIQFLDWQKSIRSQDMAVEMALVERRRLEGKISYEDAIAKREELVQENKAIAEALKKDTEDRIQKLMRQREKDMVRLRQMVEAQLLSVKGIEKAQKEVMNKKREIAKQINEESKRLQQEALIEAEAEMRKKLEVIAEIRALEATNNREYRQKVVDLTKTTGYRLMCEMSIVELRERLDLMREENKEKLEEKRQEILEVKENKQKQLDKATELIGVLRTKYKQEEKLEAATKTGEKEIVITDKQKQEISELDHILKEKKSLRQLKQQSVPGKMSRRSTFNKDKSSLESIDQLESSTKCGSADRISQILSV